VCTLPSNIDIAVAKRGTMPQCLHATLCQRRVIPICLRRIFIYGHIFCWDDATSSSIATLKTRIKYAADQHREDHLSVSYA
jgi:hypothetical protein